eukprot:12463542-Alexandrium_andersonii.AAC.1
MVLPGEFGQHRSTKTARPQQSDAAFAPFRRVRCFVLRPALDIAVARRPAPSKSAWVSNIDAAKRLASSRRTCLR